MPYRVEDSPNARAGCKNKECKDEGVKIQKGELRFASQVTIKEHTTWVYKHWGCVTPAQIGNWNEENGGDSEMVDGYDDLSTESKAKVDYALKHGHVADEDWKGDVEVNRPGQKGFRAKASKAKAPKKQAAEDEDEEEDQVPKANGKRGRPKKETNEDQAPAPKKARGKKAAPKKEIDEDDVAEPELPKAKRGKKVASKKEVDEDNVEELEPPKAKRGKKVAPKKNVNEDDAEAEEPEPPKAKRGKKAAATEKSEKTAPTKRSGRKKAAVNYEEE